MFDYCCFFRSTSAERFMEMFMRQSCCDLLNVYLHFMYF